MDHEKRVCDKGCCMPGVSSPLGPGRQVTRCSVRRFILSCVGLFVSSSLFALYARSLVNLGPSRPMSRCFGEPSPWAFEPIAALFACANVRIRAAMGSALEMRWQTEKPRSTNRTACWLSLADRANCCLWTTPLRSDNLLHTGPSTKSTSCKLEPLSSRWRPPQPAMSGRSRSSSSLVDRRLVRPRSMAGLRLADRRWHCLQPASSSRSPGFGRSRSNDCVTQEADRSCARHWGKIK